MTYKQQILLARIVAVLLGMVGFVQVSSLEASGLNPQALYWLSVATTGLGIAAGFLPNVRGRATDAEFLKDRIQELPKEERRQLARDLANAAVRDKQIIEGFRIANRSGPQMAVPPRGWEKKEQAK